LGYSGKRWINVSRTSMELLSILRLTMCGRILAFKS